MITDADIERIVPRKTQVDAGGAVFTIYSKIMIDGQWHLASKNLVWSPQEYRDWTILEPTLDLSKLKPGETILRRPDGWYHLFLGRVENAGIHATGGVEESGRLHQLSGEVVKYFPYPKCKTWTMVEEKG